MDTISLLAELAEEEWRLLKMDHMCGSIYPGALKAKIGAVL